MDNSGNMAGLGQSEYARRTKQLIKIIDDVRALG